MQAPQPAEMVGSLIANSLLNLFYLENMAPFHHLFGFVCSLVTEHAGIQFCVITSDGTQIETM